jgi:alanyl-tRNA synthetase
LRKDIASTERASGKDQAEALLSAAKNIKGFKLVSGKVETNSNEALRELGDLLKGKLGSGVVVVGSVINNAPTILVMITKDLVNKGLNAGEAVKAGATLIGGGGGGRADIAQAGGNLKDRLEEGMQASVESLANQIE